MVWKVNSSNLGKLEEYRRFLGDVESIQMDLPEPDADALTIIRYKASQFNDVIVDDVVLDVEGADLGTQIRYRLPELDSHIGRSARFTCLIGVRRENRVFIFRGEQTGTIVSPRGHSFGFNPYFQPDGTTKTFGEEIPENSNPRFRALQALKKNEPWRIEEILLEWSGSFQKSNR